jgi:hypothetical protein
VIPRQPLVLLLVLVLVVEGALAALVTRYRRWPSWTLWCAPLAVLSLAWVLHAREVRAIRHYGVHLLGVAQVHERATPVGDALGPLITANAGAAVLLAIAAIACGARAWRRGGEAGLADAFGALASFSAAVLSAAGASALRETSFALRAVADFDVDVVRGARILGVAGERVRAQLGWALPLALLPVVVVLVLGAARASGRRAARRAWPTLGLTLPFALALGALSVARVRGAREEVLGPAGAVGRWPSIVTVAPSESEEATLLWVGDEVLLAQATDALADDAALAAKVRNARREYFSGFLAPEGTLDAATLYRFVSEGDGLSGATSCGGQPGWKSGNRYVQIVVRVEAAPAGFYAALEPVALGSPPEIEDPALLYVSPTTLRLRRSRAAPIEEGPGVLDALPEGPESDRAPIIVTASKDTPASVLVPILAKATRRRFFSLEQPGAEWPPPRWRAELRVVHATDVDAEALSRALATSPGAEALRRCIWRERVGRVTLAFARDDQPYVSPLGGEAFISFCATRVLRAVDLRAFHGGYAVVDVAGLVDRGVASP